MVAAHISQAADPGLSAMLLADTIPTTAMFDFHRVSTEAANDQRLRKAVRSVTLHYCDARRHRLQELPDSSALRGLAKQIRQHTLDHLDYYLEQLVAKVEQAGGQVHFATDAAEAQRIVLDIASQTNCRHVVKSKSTVSEEIGLTAALLQAGLDVVETDLGRFIGQISHDRPGHPQASVIHKDQASIAQTLAEYLKVPPTDDPQKLGMQVRTHLRDKFRQADMGITGANFLIAETGQVCLLANDGNPRQCLTPRVLVTVTGIEKVVPRLADLSVMLKLLARSATGQTMAVYTSLFGGIRKAPQQDGPEEFHLVLLDNGRSRILDSGYREVLQCIHCGACVNTCPVYRSIGGQAYGHAYVGPIGAILAPLLDGLEQHTDLPYASTLCGACTNACPVKINIPKHLMNLRRDIVARRLDSRLTQKACQSWMRLISDGALSRIANVLRNWRPRRRTQETEWIPEGDGLLANWTQVRDLPAPTHETFHHLWLRRRSDTKGAHHD
ncbi:MAG: LutB/LldF family L-lactate oxidation iron-sulfur protein [Bacillota bacterium]